jgi:hypothetical protein
MPSHGSIFSPMSSNGTHFLGNGQPWGIAAHVGWNIGLLIDAWVDNGQAWGGGRGAAFGLVGHSLQGFLVHARA